MIMIRRRLKYSLTSKYGFHEKNVGDSIALDCSHLISKRSDGTSGRMKKLQIVVQLKVLIQLKSLLEKQLVFRQLRMILEWRPIILKLRHFLMILLFHPSGAPFHPDCHHHHCYYSESQQEEVIGGRRPVRFMRG